MQLEIIRNKIYEIRGQKIMFDFDLAELYEVETRILNQSVKRNIARFPKDFMFQLTQKEWEPLRSQIVISSKMNDNNSSQIVMSSKKHRGAKYLPLAFTEHGVTMLAAILKSDKAVAMNIAIVRTFIALRQFALNYKELAAQILELKQTVGNHNEQLNQIYDALENLLDDKIDKTINKKMWEQRERIGFKTKSKK